MKPKLFLQKKRKAPQRGFRLLHASTSRKRQRATTANADDMDEVPNFGVMSALVVILVLHLVAIGAIYIHNKLNGGETYSAASAPTSEKSSIGALPSPDEKYEHYLFEAGDSYELIARKKRVDLDDLKKVNDYKQAGVGDVINLPLLKKDEKVVPALAVIPDNSEPEPPIRPTSRPVIQVDDEIYNPMPPAEMVEVLPADGPAVLLRPRKSGGAEAFRVEPHVKDESAPRAVVVEEATPEPVREKASSKTHTIKSGDTIWRISRKYKVDEKALMRLNGISDPGRISIGKVLKIPN